VRGSGLSVSDRPFDPQRFLLFGVIGSIIWALLGVILVVTTGQGQWWMLVVGGLVTAAWAAARLRFCRHRD
jgi:membrane protein DedA with SNARE-associated domain